ncbi:uncharacterized protein DDB_G0271670 [Eurytemora carolleeae]|uniref:uncharacterized protein DDB_G0271670 n=1 Tax=Eurytemora carolleeae TaxID=1294199 RepID=UPI000C78C85C|nr:uncharacterized protein DDB_G0271670 [Eurytemora carolleeae]|eukprot:XP_023327607.1 uncharacterized protein DDB_G0271670-like [Eurytemora affinis]
MKMKLILLFISMLACTCTQARREKNCGLTCYRWGKCMGQLDGTNRPGQLGDTGIIVLNTCSPIEKGCDCLTFLEAEKTTTTTTTTTTTAAPASAYGSSRSGLSRVRNHLRVPRKLDQDLYKEIEEKASIVQTREVSSLKPTRQTYRQRTGIRSSFGRSSSSGNSYTSSASSSTSSESSPVSSVSYSTSSSSSNSSSYSTSRKSNRNGDESSTPSIPATTSKSARISAARRNLFNSERRRSLRFKH